MNPSAAHHIGLSNGRSPRHILIIIIIISDGQSETYGKVHHNLHLVDYNDLEILFLVLNWVKCDESLAALIR